MVYEPCAINILRVASKFMEGKNIVLQLFLYSSFQAFVLGVVFLFKKGIRKANRLFAFFMFLFSVHLVLNYLNWNGQLLTPTILWNGLRLTPSLIFLLLFKPVVMLLYGPLLYLYFKRIFYNQKRSVYEIFHLLPVALYYVLAGGFLLLPFEKKVAFLTENESGMYEFKVPFIIFIGTLIFYLYKIYRKLFSQTLKLENLKIWAIWMFASLGAYVMSVCVIFTLFTFDYMQYNDEYEYLIGFVIILPIWVATYFAYILPEVFSGERTLEGFPFGKYKKSGLTKSYSIELRNNLTNLLVEEQIYKQSDLSLEVLAQKLETTRHNTSQIINEHFNFNFFELINTYRIEEAQRIFEEDNGQNLSIMDVALETGFNNRVTFNKIFKSKTGHTPSEFKTSVKKSIPK